MQHENSLYVTRLTTIDCGLLLGKTPKLVGFSFNVSIQLTGELDPDESVIVDFGQLKKDLKNAIDSIEYGYDHKCIMADYRKIGFANTLNSPCHIAHKPKSLCSSEMRQIMLIDPHANMALSWHTEKAVRIADTEILSTFLANASSDQFFKAVEQVEGLIVPMLLEYLLSAMEQEIQQFLKREIEKLYPSIGKRATLEVNCDLNFDSPAKLTSTKPMNVNPKDLPALLIGSENDNSGRQLDIDESIYVGFFSYTHGLKNSTSLGCQNILHGHLSYIMINCDSSDWILGEFVKVENLIKSILADLNGTHFVNSENTLTQNDEESNTRYTKISYNSKSRGDFGIRLSDWDKNTGKCKGIVDKAMECPTETTVENLVHFVYQKYRAGFDRLKGIKSLYVSEGLHKGAVINFK